MTENQKTRVIAMQLFATAIIRDDRLREKGSFQIRQTVLGLETV